MTRPARRLAPSHDADDVIQDALERAWRKRDQYDPERGSANAWLLAITADRARALRRTAARRLRIARGADEAVGGAGDTADRTVHDNVDTELDLERATAELPERQRLAVTLHYFLDLPVAEAARVMDCSPGTVKSTLFDARRSLRDALGDDNDEH